MRTKLFVLLFVFLLLLSACKKDENSSERDNIQSETTSEEALNSGTQQAKEATGTQQVDNSKNRPALQQVDNKNIEHNLLLTYNLEEPTSSNTASADSHLKIIFASDDANPALKSEYRDKELGKLVTISPKIDGEWFGSKSGKNIVFKPTEEWSANTKYTVTMDKTLFNTKYKVNKLSDSFKSEAFTYYINKENLNNNFDKGIQQYILHIKFNYLFNQKQFKKEASLMLDRNELKFKVVFDKDGYGATITSDTFDMKDDKEQVLMFSVPRIESASGDSKLAYEISHSFVVSNISEGTRFFLDSASAPIVKDENNNPRHVLVLTFSEAVNMADLIDNMRLYDEDDNKVNLTPINTGNSADVVHSFAIDYDVKESTALSLYIRSSLKSVSGISLKYDVEDIVTLNPIQPSLNVLQKGTLLSLNSEKNITFESRGANSLDISVGKVLPEQIQHIITFTRSQGLGDVNFNTSSVDETNFSEYKNTKLPLASSDKIYPSYATINLADYLGGKPGLYYVKATSLI